MSDIGGKAQTKNFQSSAQYLFVRGRQLEGTFPGDAATGCWPITVNRIGRGWGVPPEDAWPYDVSIWPPREPQNIDAIAKRYPGGRYQRVRTLEECKAVIAIQRSPVMVSLDITEDRYLLHSGWPHRLWFPCFLASGWRIFAKGTGSIITAC